MIRLILTPFSGYPKHHFKPSKSLRQKHSHYCKATGKQTWLRAVILIFTGIYKREFFFFFILVFLLKTLLSPIFLPVITLPCGRLGCWKCWKKIRGRKKQKRRECETDDRSRPLSERSSPGVNIAFPRLPQLQACSLFHFLPRAKMEERRHSCGTMRISPAQPGMWDTDTRARILLKFNATAVTSSVSLWLKQS